MEDHLGSLLGGKAEYKSNNEYIFQACTYDGQSPVRTLVSPPQSLIGPHRMQRPSCSSPGRPQGGCSGVRGRLLSLSLGGQDLVREPRFLRLALPVAEDRPHPSEKRWTGVGLSLAWLSLGRQYAKNQTRVLTKRQAEASSLASLLFYRPRKLSCAE